MLGRDAMVVEHRLDPLQPPTPLVGQVLIQPHLRARLQHQRRRDPRVGQRARLQQLPQMLRVEPVGLRVAPAASEPGHLRRLGQMRPHPGRPAFLDHEPPPGAALHRQVHLPAGEALQPTAERLPVRRADPATGNLAGSGVQDIESDLLPVQIQPTYDRHRDLLEHLHEHRAFANPLCSRAEGAPPHVICCVIGCGRRRTGSPAGFAVRPRRRGDRRRLQRAARLVHRRQAGSGRGEDSERRRARR